jgi:hypothetical protein
MFLYKSQYPHFVRQSSEGFDAMSKTWQGTGYLFNSASLTIRQASAASFNTD